MSMRKGIRKIVSLVTAGIMAVSLLTVGGQNGVSEAAEAVLDSASLINYSTILGRSVDFGITADKLIQGDHMETTIAVKEFSNVNNSANDIDLAGTDPVHLIIGEVKQGKIVFDKTAKDDNGDYSHMIYNIETTDVVRSTYIETRSAYNGDLKFNIAEKDVINENIKKMIDHFEEKSTYMVSRGAEIGFTPEQVGYKDGKFYIDVTAEKYKDRTVYVNVPQGSELASAIAESEGLIIKKNTSTVIVFNMPATNSGTNLVINQIRVDVSDGVNAGKEIKSGNQSHSGSDSDHNKEIDAEICQKIVWNMPNSTKIEINNTAGLFLAPVSGSEIQTRTSSAGWIASAGSVKTNNEWHYIYHGRSKDVNEGEGIGQMHFAARKTFTESYTTVKEDTTILLKEGDYKFNLYANVGDDYNIALGQIIGTAQNDAQSKIKFPTLSFDTAGTYYYVIKEQNPGATKSNGIKNSDGEIDIKVVVAIDGSKKTFTVSSYQYYTADDKAHNNVRKKSENIVMSGVEFSLGGYYNQIVKDIGTLKVTKTVNGAPASAGTKEYSYTISNTEGKYLNSDGTLSDSPVTLKIKGGETKVFEGLPYSTYTVTEDTNAAKITNYTLASTSITEGSAVLDNAGDVKTVDLKNDYDQDKGQLEITKTVVQATATVPEADKTYSFAVKNSEGSYVKNTNGEIGTSTPVFLSPVKKNEKLLIKNLPVGTYTVEEQDARIDHYTLTVTGLGDYNVTKDSKTEVTVDNKYTTPKAPSGNIHIIKQMTTDSDPIPDGKTFPISISFDTAGSYAVNGTVVPFAANTPKIYYLGTTGSIDISDIPVNVKYTISEALTGAEYNGYTGEDITNATGTIQDGVTVNVKVTNKYVKPIEKGALTIVKAKAADSEAIPAAKTFPVSVSFDKAGTYKVGGTDTAFTANGKVKYDLKIGDSVSITDIPVGVKYIVTEDLTGAEYKGYTNVGIASTNSTNTIVKDQTDVVTVTNKYKELKGSIQITKTIEGPVTDAEAKGALTFKVTGQNTGYSKDISLKDFTYSADKYIYTLNDLVKDTYYVEETTTDVKGYKNVSVKFSIGDSGELIEKSKTTALTIDGNLQVVHFTDTYEKEQAASTDKGSIVIRKIFGGEALTKEQKDKITFTIAKDGKEVKTVTFKDAVGVGDITVNDLEVGDYTVTETQYDVTGLKATTVYKVVVPGKDDAEGTGAAATVAVGKDAISRVEFTNTYTKEEAATTQQATTEVTTEATTAATTEATTQATTAATTEAVSGTKRAATKKGTAEDDEDKGDGNLIITIYDEKTGDVVPGAKITVTSPSGKETKYTTNDDGQVTLKNIAAGEYKVTVTDVPEGYTVTENAEVSIQVVKNKTTKAQVRIDKDGEVSVSSKTTKSATKTGDTVPVVPIAAAFIIAVLGLVILMFKRRENA